MTTATAKPTQTKFRTWRIVVPVLLAAMGAFLCAGPGSLAVPSTLRLIENFACPRGAHAALPTVAPDPAAQMQTVYCVGEAGAPQEATLAFFGAGASFYFLLLLVPLLALGLTVRFSGAPGSISPRPLSRDAETELKRLIVEGRQLEAIKMVQRRLGTSRRWARDYVAELAKQPIETAPAGARAASVTVVERLKQLKELLESQLISEEEYEAKRFDILEAL
ncbi:MAG: hypothetical protein IT317_21145 [Anaerolineales bacterium]|nr:hypothetical protein [Anaerolineales bacterium]